MDCTEFIDYYNRKSNFNRINGMIVLKLERGYAEVEMTVNDNSLNVLGSLHGGALYTLADTAAGVASLSYGITSVTLNGSMSYIKPVICGKVKAIASEISRGRKIGVYDVCINDENERLLAKAIFTMYIIGNKIEM
jgi:acyl-CoA thioesterase